MIELVGGDDPRLAWRDDLGRARREIETVPPGDEAMEADRTRILELLARHDDLAHRTCLPGHLTGSAFVVDAPGERTLLLFHRKLQRWLQPGGHADGETNLAAVAWREATEETGIAGLRIHPVPIDLDVHEVRPPKEPPHLHLDLRYRVVAPEGAIPVANDESDALRWVARDELATYDLDPGLRRLAAAAFALMAPG